MEKYPLNWPFDWPRTKQPRRSRFGKWNNKPSIAAATDQLLHELRLFGINECIISSNLKYKGDNTPYSGQKEPDDPGIAVYFKYKKQDTVMACDSFDKVGCNIMGIAKSIEAMRSIERYGCSELMNRAFTGFKQLAGPIITKAPWYIVLGIRSDATKDQIKEAYRKKALETHPDRPGGSAEEFKRVSDAYREAIYDEFK